MSKKIVISAVCFCCNERDTAVPAVKPTPRGISVLKNECPKCWSINTYRLSIRYGNIKVETIHVSASPAGRKLYEERMKHEFTADQAE